MINSRDGFFGAAEGKDIANELMAKVDDWCTTIQSTTNYERMRKSYLKYYSLSPWGGPLNLGVRRRGEQGQYRMLNVNEYRNLLTHLLTMVTAQRPAYKCRSTNTDVEAMASASLGDGVLDYYLREKKVERYLKMACEAALVFSEGYMCLDWDTSLGEVFDVDPVTQKPIYDGDLFFSVHSPLDIIRDRYRRDDKMPWVIKIQYKNKYDLAAKYPELASDIKGISDSETLKLRLSFLGFDDFNYAMKLSEDLVPEYTFYHEKSPVLPQGRMVTFLDKNIKLFDGPLPYKNIPVYRIAPGHQLETSWGYTPGFDLLSLQDAYDTLNSIVLSNQSTFGLGVVVAPEGHNIDYRQLAKGFSLITVNENKGQLRSLNLTNTPAEVFRFSDMLAQKMERLSGVNSVIRGQPDANIKSGSFAALIASQAIQFNSWLQQSYTQLAEDVGQGIIEILQQYANSRRVAQIVGKSNEYEIKYFKGEDLKGIARVTCEVANPATMTMAGNMNMAEILLNAGQLRGYDEFIQIYTTGRLNSAIQPQKTQMMLIAKENERLMSGDVNVPVMITDKHMIHIEHHRSVLDNLDSREDPRVVEAVTAHIQAHLDLLKTGDPEVLSALGEQPMQTRSASGTANLPQNPTAAVEMPAEPGMPTNPLTGEQFQPIATQPSI